jgi:D-alanyl-D-alanine dipeptidase
MRTNNKTRRILGYDDLVAVNPGDSKEPLVDILTYDQRIISQYNKYDMLPFTGNTILVRDTVAKMLAAVNARLLPMGYRLKAVYGYRRLSVQRAYFERRKRELQLQAIALSEAGLDKYTHNFVAVPEVAGHPVGGAIDLTLVTEDNKEVDMGTAIADYSDPRKICTDAETITAAQAANRAILHDAMVTEGFAPFYGEWWHFSYGDREWAAFYNKKKALYGAFDI